MAQSDTHHLRYEQQFLVTIFPSPLASFKFTPPPLLPPLTLLPPLPLLPIPLPPARAPSSACILQCSRGTSADTCAPASPVASSEQANENVRSYLASKLIIIVYLS